MIRSLLRAVAACILGVTASFALIFGVEIPSIKAHPFRSDFTSTEEDICIQVARYPNWIRACVVSAGGLTAAVGSSIAQRIGNVYSSTALGILLLAIVAMNIAMLPYSSWFKFVITIAVPNMPLTGVLLALQKTKLRTNGQQA